MIDRAAVDEKSAVAPFFRLFHSKIMSKYPFLFQKDVREALIDSKKVQKHRLSTLKTCRWTSVTCPYFSTGFAYFYRLLYYLFYLYTIYIIFIFPLSRHPQDGFPISFFSYVECFPDGKQGCCLWQQKLLVIKVSLMPIKSS